MNKIISASILLAFFLCLSFLVQPCILAAHDIYTEDNTVKETLDNGMVVVIHEMRKTPIVNIDIIVKTGSATEGRLSGSGISHLLEHMLFKEKSEKGADADRKRIKALGGDINGFTSRDYTGYTVAIDSKYAVEALAALKDILASPSFDALELQKEKEVVLDEIRKNKDSPARLALDFSWSSVFKEHPYKYPVIGHEDLFARLGKEEIGQYYSERYSPHNMILVASGDVEKDSLMKEIKNIFGTLKRNFIPPASNISESPQLTQQRRVEYRPITLSHVVLSYKSASINDASLYPLDILAIALGKGEDSILTKELRNKKKLVYHITCHNYTLKDSGLFFIYFTADRSKVDDAIAATLEELEKAKKAVIGANDLNKSKEIARAEYLYSLETTVSRTRDISTSEAMTNNYNFSQFYLDKLLAVESSDVKSAAGTYLSENFLNTVLILPEEKKTTAPLSHIRLQAERKTEKEIMPEGAKILICEDRSMPVCAISLLFLGGVRSEDSVNNGVSHLVSRLLLDGTSGRSEEEIKSSIESLGGNINSISGNNTFGITVKVLSDHWKTAIEIMGDAVKNSVFSDEKIEKEKTLSLAGIKAREDDITRSGLLLFKRNFFRGHPYQFDTLGTRESIENIKRADILRHYESLCVPANMAFTVVGDIDAAEVVSEIEKHFSDFKRRDPILPKPPTPQLLTKKEEIAESMKREQSLVVIGFPSVRLTDNDRYVFEAIESIMSGIDGRMFNIRDDLGMAYMIGSSFMPGMERGYYIFYALTSEQNILPIKDAILKEIGKVKRKFIPEEELEAAKRYLITSHMARWQQSDALGLKISLDELYGLGYDNFKTYGDRISSVTAGQIKRVANQYFNMENSLTVIIRGEAGEEKAI